jgi:hypothetical protein
LAEFPAHRIASDDWLTWFGADCLGRGSHTGAPICDFPDSESPTPLAGQRFERQTGLLPLTRGVEFTILRGMNGLDHFCGICREIIS